MGVGFDPYIFERNVYYEQETRSSLHYGRLRQE